MRCGKCKKLIIPYIENALPSELMEQVAEHIEICPECNAEYLSMTQVTSAIQLSDYPAKEPAMDMKNRVLSKIADEGRSVGRSSRYSRLSFASAAAIGILFIAFGISIFYTADRGREGDADIHQAIQNTVTRQAPPSNAAVNNTPGGIGQNLSRHAKDQGPANHMTAKPVPMKSGAPATQIKAAPRDAKTADLTVPANQSGSEERLMYNRNGVDAVEPSSSPMITAKSARVEPEMQGSAAPDSRSAVAETFGMQSEDQQEPADAKSKSADVELLAPKSTGLGGSTDGGLDDAIESYKQRLAESPNDTSLMLKLMELYRDAGHADDEYAIADRLTKAEPANPDYWFAKGQAAEHANMPRTAIVCYRYAINKGLAGGKLELARSRVDALRKSGENK